jgi:hypothetical protein
MPKWLSHRAKTALAPKGLKRNLGSIWPFLIYSAYTPNADGLKAYENAYILVGFIFRLVENSPRKC